MQNVAGVGDKKHTAVPAEIWNHTSTEWHWSGIGVGVHAVYHLSFLTQVYVKSQSKVL